MKLEEIYDKQSFEAFADCVNQSNKKKFKDGIMLSRTFTKIDPTLIEKKYPENAFLNSGIAVSNIGGYANTIQTLRVSGSGGFNTMTSSDSAKGVISLIGEATSLKVYGRAARLQWEDTEVQQAAMEGFNLQARYVQEVDKIYKQDLDKAEATGIVAGQYGVLNHPDFTAEAASAPITTSTNGTDAYNLISEHIQAQKLAVKHTPEYMANKFAMPSSTITILQKLLMDSAAGNGSVLSALMSNFPEISFFGTSRAEDVGGVKVGSLYSTSADALKVRIPVPLKNYPLTVLSSTSYSDYVYRVGGIDVLEAACGYIVTSI